MTLADDYAWPVCRAEGLDNCLAVHYMVVQPLRDLLENFGHFQATVAWFNDCDPFGRGQSVMPWDRQTGQHVLHDPRSLHGCWPCFSIQQSGIAVMLAGPSLWGCQMRQVGSLPAGLGHVLRPAAGAM